MALVLLTWSGAGLDPALALRPLLFSILLATAASLAFAALLDDPDRGGLLSGVLMLILVTSDDLLAIVLGAAGLIIVVEGIARRGRPTLVAVLATRLLSIVCVILLAVITIGLVQDGTLAASIDDLTQPGLPDRGQAMPGSPDIYVLLLDAYPGDRIARRGTAFDANALPSALEAKGFGVVRDAHSNYLLTPTTLASMLSMEHIVDIPALSAPFGPRDRDWRRLRHVINANRAFATLREHGYTTTTIDAGFAHAQVRRVDRYIEQPQPMELENLLLGETRLHDLIEAVAPGTKAQLARDRITGEFAAVTALAAEPHDGPRLVYVHIPTPHPPWVFEADGRPRNPERVSLTGEDGLSTQAALDLGFAQATHIASMTEDAIDAILATSKEPPVIVVFSDHGPGGPFSTVDPLSSDIPSRASSFLAVLSPGHPELLADRPSLVNLFNRLFTAYLGAAPRRLPDTIWAWRESYVDVVEAGPFEGWPP